MHQIWNILSLDVSKNLMGISQKVERICHNTTGIVFMSKPWLNHYPEGVPHEIDVTPFVSLTAWLDEAFKKFADRPAYSFLGSLFSYAYIDQQSRQFAAYLQSLGLVKGDRVAVMMPNVPQYPVAVAGILRAGLVVINVNPLYTPRELEHQMQDAGARVIVILDNFASVLEQCEHQLPALEHVVLTSFGDALPWPKRTIVNLVVSKVKKLVPPFKINKPMISMKAAVDKGASLSLKPVAMTLDDLAVLQYTGGTTGVAKGAELLHRNLIANVLQCEAWYGPAMKKIPHDVQPVTVCALPLYHIFAFTVNMMLSFRTGSMVVLIPNPRDLPAVFKDLGRQPFHSFPAVNTLFNALANHADVDKIDWSSMVLTIGGGMAVQQATAKLWLQKTGCPIVEGYGLSETSPVIACNPTDSHTYTGTIGLPLPSTDIRLLDDAGNIVPTGSWGEISVRGPQVMRGYWQRQDETDKVMTDDGFMRTGDIGIMDEKGYVKIVDRKKDMILVSGFNVYPNEVEDVLTMMDGIAECAAIGVPDEKSGEAVKIFVVKRNPSITESEIRAYCAANLTGYKRPRFIEFIDVLPKTPVGKILRRALRDKT